MVHDALVRKHSNEMSTITKMFSHLGPSQVVGQNRVCNVQVRLDGGKVDVKARSSLNVASANKTKVTEEHAESDANKEGSCARYHGN